MSSDLNNVNIIGRLVKNAEQRQLSNGKSLASFRLASGRSYNTASGEKKEETVFIDCTVFGKPAEILVKYTNKGSQLAIQGRLRQSSWEKEGVRQSKIEIVVEGFQFLGSNNSTNVSQSSGSPPVQPENEPSFSDDDIPF